MQHNKDVKHQGVKMYCEINQFPESQFIGPHNKPHGVHGLGKHYNMRFDPKLDHGLCTIHHISCAYPQCTSIID